MEKHCKDCGSIIEDGASCNCKTPKKKINYKLILIALVAVLILGIALVFIPKLFGNKYEGDMNPIIDEISSTEGPIGTLLYIEGSGFGEYSVNKGIKIKDEELMVLNWSHDEIIAVISNEKQSGKIKLFDYDKDFDTDVSFKLEKLILNKMTSIKIKKVDEINEVEDKDSEIKLIIPENTLDESDTLTISSVKNSPPNYSKEFKIEKVFDVSLKSENSLLNDYVMFNFKIDDEDDSSEYGIATWNEESLVWELLHESLIYRGDGYITGFSNHFSFKAIVKIEKGYFRTVYHTKYFAIECSNENVINIVPNQYTPEEFADLLGAELDRVFEIYSSNKVKADGWKTFYQNNNHKAQEIAKTMAIHLDAQRKKGFVSYTEYKELITKTVDIISRTMPSDINGAASRISIPVVVGNSAIGQFVNGAQELFTKNKPYNMNYDEGETVQDVTSFLADAFIKLPVTYDDMDDLNITAAHELFHAFQIENFTMFGIGWFEKISEESHKNLWLLEATAEYAAHNIANPYSVSTMYKNTFSNSSYTLYTRKGDGQEYGMSMFVKYLIDNTNSTFQSIWDTLLDCDGALNNSFEEYITTLSGETMPKLYGDFWDELILGGGNISSNAIGFNASHYNKNVKLIGESPVDINVEVKYEMNENAINYFALQPTIPNHKESVIYSLKTDGKENEFISISSASLNTNYDVKALTHRNNTYSSFTKEVINGEQAINTLLTFDDFTKAYILKVDNENTEFEVKQSGSFIIEEIKTSLAPKEVKIIPDNNIKFTAKFSNVFDFAEKLEVEWDFGDGNIETDELQHKNNITVKEKHKYDKEITGFVTVRLYDITSGTRQLIANHKVAIGEVVELDIEVDEDDLITNKDIVFTTDYDSSLYYEWEVDKQISYSGLGQIGVKHKYETPGKYTIMVTAYKNSSKEALLAYGERLVEIEQGFYDIEVLPNNEIYLSINEEVELNAICNDLYDFPSGYILEWSSDDAKLLEINSEFGEYCIAAYGEEGSFYADVIAYNKAGDIVAKGSKQITILEEEKEEEKEEETDEYNWELVYIEANPVDYEYGTGTDHLYQSFYSISNGYFSGEISDSGPNYRGELKYTGTFTEIQSSYKSEDYIGINFKIITQSLIREGDVSCTVRFGPMVYSPGDLIYNNKTYEGVGAEPESTLIRASNKYAIGSIEEATSIIEFPKAEKDKGIYLEFSIYSNWTGGYATIRYYFDAN